MGFFKRLLCCCCKSSKKSRKAREEYVRTPGENHQQNGFEERSATVQHSQRKRSAQPFASQDLHVASDPEMPAAQIIASDPVMPAAQIKNNVNEAASQNQHHLEKTAGKIEPDLEKRQHNIQDVINNTADKLQRDLRRLSFEVEGELDEIDREIRQGPSGRRGKILLSHLHRENENIRDSLAELSTQVQRNLDQTAAKIQSSLDNVAASVQCDPKRSAARCRRDQKILGMDVLHDLKVPTVKRNLEEENGQSQLQLETEMDESSSLPLFDQRVPVNQFKHDQSEILIQIGGNPEVSRDETGEVRESAEKKLPECGSELGAQAAVGQSELEIETTAPHCELQERTESHISEESFVFHKVLGRGGFGKVMLAELKASGEYYAVKSMTKASFLEHDDMDIWRTEKRVLMLCTGSPFLSRLHCAFQTKDNIFLVMEYINGGNLHYHLQHRGPFDLATVRFYAAEIICGLQFLHRKGVIYRDLKLENVMLDRDGHIKIVDFGLSKDNMFGNSRADTFCGSPLYIAPEIYRGKEYSAPVDWWAFGVLLFQMLTGETPFYGEDEFELCQAVCWSRHRLPVWIDRSAKDLVDKLLLKDPNRRLGACGNIRAHPFFKLINWARIEKREVRPPYRPTLTSPLDCRYFEEEYLSEEPVLSQGGKVGSGLTDQPAFLGFTFVNSKFAAHVGH